MKNRAILLTVIAFQIITLIILGLSGFISQQSPFIVAALIVIGVIVDLYINNSFSVFEDIKEKRIKLRETATLQHEIALNRIKTDDDLITLKQLQDNYIRQLETIKDHLYSNKSILDNEIIETTHVLRNAFNEIYTKNSVINTILVLKRKTALNMGIDVSYSVTLTDSINVVELDMCTLLCNMLDNAIEAASKCSAGSGYLKLQIKQSNSYLFVSTKNPVKDNTLQDFSVTSKVSPQDHGFGVDLIKNIAEKYKGHMSINQPEPGSVQVIVALTIC